MNFLSSVKAAFLNRWNMLTFLGSLGFPVLMVLHVCVFHTNEVMNKAKSYVKLRCYRILEIFYSISLQA